MHTLWKLGRYSRQLETLSEISQLLTDNIQDLTVINLTGGVGAFIEGIKFVLVRQDKIRVGIQKIKQHQQKQWVY
jgi:hypothetical protein